MKIDWELTEKSEKFIHHGECESWYKHQLDTQAQAWNVFLLKDYIV